MIGIYKFTNKIDGKSYIGQSVDIHKRFLEHKNRHDIFGKKDRAIEDTYFHSMLRHYGFHNFDFEVLEECSKEQLNTKEKYYISFYNTLYPNGYNKTSGGESGSLNKLNSYDDLMKIISLLKNSSLSNLEIGALFGVSDQTISDINSGRSWFQDDTHYPIRDGRYIANKRYTTKRKQILKTRKCVRPNKEELEKLLIHNSYKTVGKIFGVSGTAVQKWCKLYEIPQKANLTISIAT